MTRPMQFSSRFPWVILLLVGLPILPLPLAAVFWLVTPPLQNYYLMAYLDSTERPRQPSATTQVEWLYKTAPGRKPEPVKGLQPHLRQSIRGNVSKSLTISACLAVPVFASIDFT